MCRDIFSGHRLFEPCEPQRFKRMRAADGFGQREALVRVDHDLEVIAHRVAHGSEPSRVFGQMWPADLDFRAVKTGVARLQSLIDEFRLR